ncbi:MAG: Ig-like domain-containing protein [Armatimonadota bacterium]
MRYRIRIVLAVVCLGVALALLPGCGGGGSGGAQTTTATIEIAWPDRDRVLPLLAESIAIVVTGPEGFTAAKTENRPVAGGTSLVTFTALPVGQLVFTATAYPQADAQGVAQATGAVAHAAQANVPLAVTLTMASTIATVTVGPAASSVSPEGTVQLTATAKNAADQIVLVPVTGGFTWSSSNESMATVDADGLVTGVSLGTVTITAVEDDSGKSGTATVTVVPFVIDLGTLGGTFSRALGINDAGQVVGEAQTEIGSYRAFRWTAAGGLQDLDPLATGESLAAAINADGQVAGSGIPDSEFSFYAFRWTDGDGVQFLGALGGSWSNGYGINDTGQVAGQAMTEAGAYHAFRWTSGGDMQDLGALGGETSVAYGINSAGQVVGQAETLGGDNLAFRWTAAGGMQDLLGAPGSAGGVAYDINDAGQIVGAVYNGNWRAFLWSPGDGLQDLGVFPGGLHSVANAVNEDGIVVGYALTSTGEKHAFRWTPDGGLQDLGTLGGAESEARGINAAGQVVGWARTSTGDQHACLWTP